MVPRLVVVFVGCCLACDTWLTASAWLRGDVTAVALGILACLTAACLAAWLVLPTGSARTAGVGTPPESDPSHRRHASDAYEELQRIRSDLHDALAPDLAAVSMRLDVARRVIDSDTDVRPMFDSLLDEVQGTIATVRSLVREIGTLSRQQHRGALVTALRERADRIMAASGNSMRVDIRVPPDLPPLPPVVEGAIHLIASEALANAARHADARQCVVELRATARAVRLQVTDDGIGICQPLRPGVGLGSMRNRATEAGGTCWIESRRRGGTRVSAFLPLSPSHDMLERSGASGGHEAAERFDGNMAS